MKRSPHTDRLAFLGEAQRHFLRAAERCLSAEQNPERLVDFLAEAIFFGALGLYRAATADDDKRSTGLVLDLLSTRVVESPPEEPRGSSADLPEREG